MNVACNLGMNNKYDIIMKLTAGKGSIISYVQQFLNSLLHWGVGKADPVFTVW